MARREIKYENGKFVFCQPPKPNGFELDLSNMTIGRNFSLNVSQIADELKITPRQLGNYFYDGLGISAKEWITQQRMVLARKFIYAVAAGELRIGDIAAQLGYSDPSHFTNAFKRCYGLSPADAVAKIKKAV
ncbi:MAG: helix-turn-helix transcriptional regulator [Deltaproteobacteria bacterium]|nr:helix-turn-helix transcriptional regulator [Deltaproteobacteria bacterium]